jgi:hypothetical protein
VAACKRPVVQSQCGTQERGLEVTAADGLAEPGVVGWQLTSVTTEAKSLVWNITSKWPMRLMCTPHEISHNVEHTNQNRLVSNLKWAISSFRPCTS